MAQLNSLIVTGDSRFLNAINGDLNGNANTSTTATKATQDESGNNIKASYASSISISDHTITLKNKNNESLGTVTVPDSSTDDTKLPLAGGTMTGTLTANASVNTDSYTGALNMNDSNIYGLNGIYTADASDGASEGINFYRDTTHVDTLWMSDGDLLFVPNRALGTNTTKANSQKVGRFTSNPTTGQIVVTDGTTGGIKSTTLATTSIGSASAGTAIPADDITSWSAGTMTSCSVSQGVLTITNGTAPSLSYDAKSIPNITVSSKSVVTGITES